ncbi:hypothetical protein H0X06_01730 [Candidatus Dependentiae bacterium]|nr:hypothetical protein [Candidatus Dependentiae bacterium]
MTRTYKDILFLIVGFYSSISLNLYSMDTTSTLEDKTENKFKMGIELQESTHLCSWANNNKKFQKVPLFRVWNKNDKCPSYHVEIDGDDIEFVTRPFTSDEEEQLEKCVENIKFALKNLKELFIQQVSSSHLSCITWEEWILSLSRSLAHDKNSLFEVHIIEDVERHTGYPLNKMTLTLPLQSMEDWSPIFVPHITIQHPIELTIPLYLTLFGDEKSLLMSLPDKSSLDYLLDEKEFSWDKFKKMYVNKESGLIFLHAFTLLRMVPSEEEVEIGNTGIRVSIVDKPDEIDTLLLDQCLLKKTLDQYQEFGQIDVKGRLLIMSRRPFSDLFNDICKSNIRIEDEDEGRLPFNNYNNEISYEEVFLLAMRDYVYSVFEKHMVLFSKVNYGEQFFLENGKPADLRGFNKYFTDNFRKNNQSVLDTLLEQGIVTTAMIRNFRDDVKIGNLECEDMNIKDAFDTCIFVLDLFEKNKLYELVLYSVQFPKKTYIINYENANELGIVTKDFLYDILSPVCFLQEDDSMGRIKDMKEQDFAFGEAIIEVRAISSVNQWFLTLYNLSDMHNKDGFFLKYTYNDISHEASQLFRFLKSFKISNIEIQKRILVLLNTIKEFKNVKKNKS